MFPPNPQIVRNAFSGGRRFPIAAASVPAKHEITPTEAAKILGMSRPTLMQLIDVGRISFRKVDKHHRITAAAIQEFHDRQREEGDPMAVVAALANTHGNID